MGATKTRQNSDIAVHERLEQLRKANHGRLTAEIVVRDAQSKDSPLHSRFNWSLQHAAMEHWLDVARELIAKVRVVIETETRSIRVVAYVRDPRAATGDQGYIAVATMRSDAGYAREVLVEEFARAASHLRRAYELSDALGLSHEVSAVISSVDTILNRLNVSQPASQAADY